MLEQVTEPVTNASKPRDGSLLEFYAEEFQPQASSIPAFRQQLSDWFFAAKHLRRFEVTRLAEKPDPADLASHRMALDALIEYGEFAGNFARTEEVDLAPLGLNRECIEAETRLLRYSVRMFHERKMSPEEAKRALDQIFA